MKGCFPKIIHTFAAKNPFHMKRIRHILAVIAILTSGTSFADSYQYLTISKTGSETSIEVNQIQKITFDATDMILTMKDGAEQKMPLSSLTKMFFSESGVNAIAKPTATLSKMTIKDGVLTADIADGEEVTLYNMKGEKVFSATQKASYDINHLPKGVYILKTSNQIKKVINQ